MPKVADKKKVKSKVSEDTESPKKGKEKANGKGTKAEVKETKKTAAKTTTKTPAKSKEKREYSPQKDTMRYFVFKALQGKPASVAKIYERAATLAGKAGVKKYSTPEAYKGFGNLDHYLGVLEENGFSVVKEGDKRAIEAK